MLGRVRDIGFGKWQGAEMVGFGDCVMLGADREGIGEFSEGLPSAGFPASND